jgi:hypothetical protein
MTALAAAGLAGCSHTPPSTPADLRPFPPRAGAGLAGQQVIVLPLESIRGGDALGWAASIASPRDFLIDANAQIARALAQRAPHTKWLLPADLLAIAGRNPGYAPDPYSVDVSQLMSDRWKPRGEVADPLASQLRRMESFTDAQIALVPVELRFFPRGPGPLPPGPAGGRAVLRVALVETRRLVVLWAGDLASDPAPTLSPTLTAGVADRLADAVATP